MNANDAFPAPDDVRKRQTGYLFLPKRWRRAEFLKWLRRTHAWFGLWGAAMGLLFGFTGILLNHRAVMKIPAGHVQESEMQLPARTEGYDSPEALARWLAASLRQGGIEPRIKAEKARPIAWGELGLTQPARWTITFPGPQRSVQAEYWVGNRFVSVKRSEHDLLSTLKQFHKASGVSAAWILLTDTLAGALIVLSLTGILLWSRLHGPRLGAAALGLGSLALLLGFGFSSL